MPKPDDDISQSEPPPVRPPTLPPDFPDIPQNPSSQLQPPPDPSATPDKVAGTTPAPAEPETSESVMKEELRDTNARLRDKINSVLEQHPDLRDSTDEIAFKQGAQVQVGTPFLERIQANLQERARAIIERRPDLEHLFDE
jgi:outer membrane protein TolC